MGGSRTGQWKIGRLNPALVRVTSSVINPRLGDGRAHLLGEVIGQNKRMYDLQLKGSGATVFSRGDGKAALKPALREYLIAEFMTAEHSDDAYVAVVGTETSLSRNAITGRSASGCRSHIRVGTFEYFAAKRDFVSVRKLADYIIERIFPNSVSRKTRFSHLRAVMSRQASLVAQWMHVGFIHGVMNTDNIHFGRDHRLWSLRF